MSWSNPNKANQYKTDPRQKLCWDFYIDPTSPTFSNAKHSAMKAGYDDSYAEHIKQSTWFCGKLRQFTMMNNAEVALGEILDMPIELVRVGVYAEGGSQFAVATSTALIKIKQETAKFVVERLGKESWSK